MLLHKTPAIFSDIVTATANDLGLQDFQIEKDYYVSLYLKTLSELDKDGLVFKGGTSLSKCYDIIHRFSEDIDLAMHFKNGFVDTKVRKRLKKNIVKTTQILSGHILNLEKTESDRDYNFYEIDYESYFEADPTLRPHILIETIVVYEPYPTKSLNVSNYITKYLEKTNRQELITKYQLEPFRMNVQTIERTLIDKLYALCDYHIQGKYERNSRHLYDIHMIWNSNELDTDLMKKIVLNVTKDRQLYGKNNSSCAPFQNPNSILKELINKGVYKDDFENITTEFIYDDVTYEQTIDTLKVIVNDNLLPLSIPMFE